MKISNYCRTLCLLGLLGASALMPTSFAQAAAPTVEADPVLVTATRVGRELHDVPMAVGVITAEEIKKNPATTIGELVRDIPGVELTQSSPGLIRISIRGESDRRTLVLVNGQKLSEQKSMDGTPILVDPANVERIEVIKGPASVLYGSDAIGGVLNIITKKSTKDAIHGSVSMTYTGADNGLTESANLYGHYQGWNYQLSASNSMHNKTSTPYGYLPDTGYGQQNLDAALSYDFTPNVTAGVNFSYFHFNSVTGAPVLENGEYVAKTYDSLTGEYSDFDFSVEIPTWSRTKVGAFLEAKDITDYFARLRIDAYYQHTYKQMYNYGAMPSPMGDMLPGTMVMMDNESNNNLSTLGLTVQTDWSLGDNHYFIVGYDFMHDTLDGDDFDFSRTPTMIPPTGFPPIPTFAWQDTHTRQYYDGTQTSHAFYLSGESTFWDQLTFHYGARYTAVITSMSRAEETTDGGATFSDAGYTGSDIQSRPVFNLGAVWRPIEEFALRASWAQGFRVPRLDEKYFGNSMGGGIIETNEDLKPETSDNFEVGVRYSSGGFAADVAAFYSIAKDYISLEDLGENADGYDVFQSLNIADATTHGVEASLSYTFENGIKPYVTATYMRRQFTTENYTTWDTGLAPLTARVGVAYFGSHFDDTVDINADVYMRAKSATKDYIPASGSIPAYTETYEGYATFNAALGVEFGPEKAWNVQAEVLNIFNTYYHDGGNYPSPVEPGTSFNLRVSYSF